MVRVTEGLLKNGLDFSSYAILEMVHSYWTEVFNSKRNAHFKYHWWKLEFKNELLKALKRVWENTLNDLELFIITMNKLIFKFDPTNYTDCEL